MSKYNQCLMEDISYSNLNIKKLEIYGDYIFEKNKIIKNMKNAIKEFLNSNKDVDYLVAYYYPTQEDRENNVALCYLKLNEAVKNMDLTDEEFCKQLLWNEYYDFFSKTMNGKTLFDAKLVNEINKILQVVDESYFILYKLWMIINYGDNSEFSNALGILEQWLIRAETINKEYWEDEISYSFEKFMEEIEEGVEK